MSALRNLAWFTKGMREYTRGGFESASKSFNQSELDGVSLEGKTVLITGANSGIGFVCSKELAKRGAELHMVCRNRERGESAKTEIEKACGDGSAKVHLHLLDMGEPQSVYTFGKDFTNHIGSLDILINNAGCMVNERKLNANQLEINFCTNTLGTYLLTESLLPALEKSKDPRVISVSSGGMLVQKLDHADPMLVHKASSFDGTMTYAQNKRQQVVLTELWAEKHPTIYFCSMHPGWADTPAVSLSMPSFHARMKNKLRTPEQGADTVIWLALTPNLRNYPSGSFFQDRKPVSKHLPLASTHTNKHQKEIFLSNLAYIAEPFKQTGTNM